MSFAQQLELDGRLLWWGLEVSFDDFATVSYRWGTMSTLLLGAQFEERIVSLSNIQRGFGNNHLPVAAAFSVVLDNTDFAMDWLVAPATVASQVFRARFRLGVGLADPDLPTLEVQQIGIFTCLDMPRRKDGAIMLSLADDSLGKLADVLVPPSFKDWFDSAPGTTDSVLPSVAGQMDLLCDWTQPAPLQFGAKYYQGFPLTTFNTERTPVDFDVAGGFEAAHRKYIYPILVLATRDDVAVTADDVTELQGVIRKDAQTVHPNAVFGLPGVPFDIPQTVNGGLTRIWKAYKTDTITKDGYDWKLLWIAFDVMEYAAWIGNSLSLNGGATGGQQVSSIPSSPDYPPALFYPIWQNGHIAPYNGMSTHFAAFDYFLVGGAPGSGITGKADLTDVGNAVSIMQDFVEHYSPLGASAVDTARFARADLVTNLVVAGGIWFDSGRADSGSQQLSTKLSPYGVGALRKAIAELAGSVDFDVFMTMEGKVAIVTQGADFETQTSVYPVYDEERINNAEDRIPSAGERWSPYNRVFVQSGGSQLGPADNLAAISDWGRIISKVIPSKWWWGIRYWIDLVSRADEDSEIAWLWAHRNLEAKIRPVLTFTTDITILAIELGDYFTMSWTRGGENAAYSETLWRLEAVTINPERGSVEATVVWMNDLQTAQPFLLDNEGLFLRVGGGGGRTCEVTDGSTTVTFSSGDLNTDGVIAGDFLRLRDSTEAATTFFRNRDVKIASITGDLELELVGDVDFGTAGAHTVGQWDIVRPYLNYPTAVSDPTNYPSGSEMFGKISNSVGQFSDASPANELLDG